jgi:hypothetical protein
MVTDCDMRAMQDDSPPVSSNTPAPQKVPENAADALQKRPREIGGPKGPEPTRYGDWEVGGRCTDF